MKLRPFDRTTLWRSAFGPRPDDPDEKDREALAAAYLQIRERAGALIGEIHIQLPNLTVHDLNHADTLWDVASEICGPDYTLNPLEGFVLGASFLIHDAGMALAAYPKGLEEIKNSPEWRDAVFFASQKIKDETKNSVDKKTQEENEATFAVLRARHASQARVIVKAAWSHPSTGASMALVQNDDLLESYGELIGQVAASHHWPITEVARFFGDSTPASASWPRAWDVDGLKLACILRCADAAAIDETRAPSFLYAIRSPTGDSKRHWAFQNKIYPAKRKGDALSFDSKVAFEKAEAADWWLAFDAVFAADQELKSADALLRDRNRQPFQVRRIHGAGNSTVLSETIKVAGWKPVNTQATISDPKGIIERLGGKQLYGDEPIVPIRELVQNAADAVRARRFLDVAFRPNASTPYPGAIFISVNRLIDEDGYELIVEDDGIGMSERVMTGPLLDFGTSFWSSDLASRLYPGLPSDPNFKPAGRFGIGFFSLFMYASAVEVHSREFREPRNNWKSLIFTNGVQARGEFSSRQTEMRSTLNDVSTIVRLVLPSGFFDRLVESSSRLDTDVFVSKMDSDQKMKYVEKSIKSMLICLDVSVKMSMFGNEPVALNDPNFYNFSNDEIWEVLKAYFPRWSEVSENQKKLMAPLGNNSRYGRCAIRLEQHENFLFKSIGGLTHLSQHDMPYLFGIVEFATTSADRSGDQMLAPQREIADWAEGQLALIKVAGLPEGERFAAAVNLGFFLKDIRPVLIIPTSQGWLSVADVCDIICSKKCASFPVRSYSDDSYYSAHPAYGGLHFDFSDVQYTKFTIVGGGSVVGDESELDDNSSVWKSIINTLRERGETYKIVFNKQVNVGRYAGEGSRHHKLEPMQVLLSDVIEVEIST